jgi:hypothetical protein
MATKRIKKAVPIDEALVVVEVTELRVENPTLDTSQRAYLLFEARGREHGRALDDWLAAESLS